MVAVGRIGAPANASSRPPGLSTTLAGVQPDAANPAVLHPLRAAARRPSYVSPLNTPSYVVGPSACCQPASVPIVTVRPSASRTSSCARACGSATQRCRLLPSVSGSRVAKKPRPSARPIALDPLRSSEVTSYVV
ncbi:hypothetical protein GCM10027569_89730 [Flindersiella endophytica]